MSIITWSRVLLLWVAFLGLSQDAAAASFNCSKARSNVEKAICADAELSRLDESMALAYKAALVAHPVKGYVKSRQRWWLEQNAAECGKDCVKNLRARYVVRLNELSYLPGTRFFASSREFSFEGGEAVVELRPRGASPSLVIWGGARIHRELSEEKGKAVYLECEFVGDIANSRTAKSLNGEETISYSIANGKFAVGDEISCLGFAAMPEDLLEVR